MITTGMFVVSCVTFWFIGLGVGYSIWGFKEGKQFLMVAGGTAILGWLLSKDKYKCPRCNYPINKNVKRCPNCGQPFDWCVIK